MISFREEDREDALHRHQMTKRMDTRVVSSGCLPAGADDSVGDFRSGFRGSGMIERGKNIGSSGAIGVQPAAIKRAPILEAGRMLASQNDLPARGQGFERARLVRPDAQDQSILIDNLILIAEPEHLGTTGAVIGIDWKGHLRLPLNS